MNRFSLPPTRRFLAVDVGSRCLKALLVSNRFGRLRVHAHRVIGLDETSQPGRPGWPRVLEELREELGSHPLVISVAQHASDSQVLDLPGSDARTIRQQIQDDIVRLSGLTESTIIYDYGQLVPFGQFANPYWVTHARESEVLAVVHQFESFGEDILEISSTANALVAAYREVQPATTNALLVDLGSSGTEVAIVCQGQGVYVTSFAVGGMLLSEQIRAERQCPAMEAEFAKNTENLLTGADAMPSLRQLVDRWHGELVRILEDWLGEHPVLNVSASQFDVVLCGGDAEMPGLLDYLSANSVLNFKRWSDLPGFPPLQPAGQFAVAFGLAGQLFRRGGPSTSLVPDEVRIARKEHGAVQVLHAGTWLVLAIIVLVLGFGTWQKFYFIREVENQLEQAQMVLQQAQQTDRLKLQLANDYEEIRPVLSRQRQTLAAVDTLGLILNHPLPTNSWFVLFADADSYYSAPTIPLPTNAPPPAATSVSSSTAARLTNAFVAEFSTDLDAPSARVVLSKMIDQFKASPHFRKVDILSPDQRRRLVKDTVVVPDGHYALSFTINDNEFGKPFLTPDEMRQLRNQLDKERSKTLRAGGSPEPTSTTGR